ncbi:hypothetical protein BDF14DRAFT_1763244 [Spinellus fusiger]|nr:hypothetical protein BDF14DRAFT_1763244 [Spinellus fusiger]
MSMLIRTFNSSFNATILAYGQTGSGKTYSMGIGLESAVNAINEGIVPRFIHALFERLAELRSPRQSFQVAVSFLELYNEDLVDLLNPKKDGLQLTIREDSHGNISWSGVREEVVHSPEQLLKCLETGSLARTTASTDMNHTSSRSHAIFSVVLKQTVYLDDALLDLTSPPTDSAGTKRYVSKFHFVDLAGSERLKRTNAVGSRAKEGISINAGLLALGNVISALGDESRRVSHIPYRDSKLTRLLQDSLGGNSQTLMLACISPADSNYTETLNTLKYANRARNIRNKATINQEQDESDRLKAMIMRLREEAKSNDSFLLAVNDEMDSLKREVQILHSTTASMARELELTRQERDILRCSVNSDQGQDPLQALMENYTQTIECLKSELQQSQQQLTMATSVIKTPTPIFDLPPILESTPISYSQLDIKRPHELKGDDSATLVGSSSRDDMETYHHENSNSSTHLNGNTNRKKKRHSHKHSIKRISKGRRMSTNSALLKLNGDKERKPTVKTIKQCKSEWREESDFLKHIMNAIVSEQQTEEGFSDTSLQENNTPLGHRLHRGKLATDIYSIAKKFQTCLEGKQYLLRQLEQAEVQLQLQQHEQKLQTAEWTAQRKLLENQQKQESADIRSQYEHSSRKHQLELQAIRKKYAQLISSSSSTQSQHQATIDHLKKKLESTKHEKKKMTKQIKQESEKTREKLGFNEREIQQLKRQEAQSLVLRKRSEREMQQQKSALKRAAEEMGSLNEQMKKVAILLKKTISQESVDRTLLAKAVACANIRGYIVKQNMKREMKVVDNLKSESLQQRMHKKKKLVYKAIAMYVQHQIPIAMITDLSQKRDRLLAEQQELLLERKLVIEECSILDVDSHLSGPQYMDERIDTITIEVDYLNQQIEQLKKSDLAPEQEGIHGQTDPPMQAEQETDPQVAYEIALSLIRTLVPEEIILLSEALVQDMAQLQCEKRTQQVLLKQSNTSMRVLQSAMIQMRRANFLADIHPESPHCEAVNMVYCQSHSNPVYVHHGLVLFADPLPHEIPEKKALHIQPKASFPQGIVLRSSQGSNTRYRSALPILRVNASRA